MLAENEAAEASNGREPGNQHRLACAPSENTRSLFLGETIQDMNAVRDSDSDHQRQRHNVSWIQRNPKKSHDAAEPNKADADRNERQRDAKRAPEMDEHEQSYSDQRIPCGLFVAALKQFGIIVKLNRSAGDARINRLQLFDEFLLVLPFPDFFLRINHNEVLAVDTDEAISQRLRQVLNAQRFAGVLILQGSEGFTHVAEKSLLKSRQLLPVAFGARRVFAQHFLAEPLNSITQGYQRVGQIHPAHNLVNVADQQVSIEGLVQPAIVFGNS